MISQEKNNRLVLTMVGDRLFFVEVEAGPSLRLLTAGEVRLKIPFDDNAIQSPQLIPEYADSVNRLVDRFAISAPHATFLLDQRLALIRRVKVDRDLTSEEVRRQVNWEMEQFLTSQRSEFHLNYEKISYQRNHFDYLIVAAVRKVVVYFITEIFKKTPLSLKVLDINILASIRGLYSLGYVETTSGFSVIIAFEEQAIHLILIRAQGYVKHFEINIKTPNTAFSGSNQPAEELATVINDKILELLDSLGDEVLLKNIENLFLLNGRAHVKVVAALQKLQRSAKVHFVEPLKNIKHSLSIEEESIIAANSMSFIALLGALQQ